VSRRHRAERGTASLEVIALYPVLVLLGLFALQAGAAMWTTSLASEAARSAARAAALDRDPRAAAAGSLPASVALTSVTRFGAPAHGVRVTVRVPRVSPIPALTVTREAVLP
jgi:Flp pilus assembly protein TadG